IFNEMRVLNTHEKNNIDFYNVIPRKTITDKYTYFKELKSDIGGLFDEDIEFLSKYFKNYNIHLSEDIGNIIIEDVSQIYEYSTEIGSIRYYWNEPQRSNYQYYLYNSTNDYDLLFGKTP